MNFLSFAKSMAVVPIAIAMVLGVMWSIYILTFIVVVLIFLILAYAVFEEMK